MTGAIPVIDLFAGPGGLGEGFSRFDHESGRHPFKVRLSIEAHPFAHKTLELRSFFRQFEPDEVPENYYDYLRGAIQRQELFERHPVEAQRAELEAWHATLGVEAALSVQSRIHEALDGAASWVLIGGPPCQAYSVVGRSRMLSELGSRERNGKPFDSDHRHLLYVQYLRVIAEHAPTVFVMENVRGLLSAKLNGQSMFEQILRDLESPANAAAEHGFESRHGDLRYKVIPAIQSDAAIPIEGIDHTRAPKDFVVKAEDFAVPQARHRVILIGVRQTLDSAPQLIPQIIHAPQAHLTIKQAIGDLPRLRSAVSPLRRDSRSHWIWEASSVNSLLRDVPNNGGLNAKTIQKISSLADQLRRRAPGDTGAEFVRACVEPDIHKDWLHDERLGGACNHSARSHMVSDLRRYLFAAAFAQANRRSPKLDQFPAILLPDHRSARSKSVFSDRFRVQVADRPSTTITSHIAKDGHYFIHYDPIQCRSLTVREAARLQTFPDNYFFEGPRTSQYVQVGNAVPPLLARHIAELVYLILSQQKMLSDEVDCLPSHGH